MIKRNLLNTGFVLTIFSFILLVSCGEEKVTAKSDQPASLSYHEEFDSMQRVIAMGWKAVNLSDPLGAASWQQGSYIADNVKGGPFQSSIASHSYKASANEHAFVPYTCGADISFINCWLISPPLSMKNGDKITFWTTTDAPPVDFPDRMQVWLNPTNDGTNVGRTANETGDFTVLLKGSCDGSAEQTLDLDRTLTTTAFDKNNFAGSGYPTAWTKFEITIANLPNGNIPQKHRVGFRYYVKNGGPNGSVSNEIGIDDFDFISQ